jgi:hypothetical protein
MEFNFARIVLLALLDDSFYIICHWYHSPYVNDKNRITGTLSAYIKIITLDRQKSTY